MTDKTPKDLTVDDYMQAGYVLGEITARKKAGKKLSRKDRAILTFSADSVAAHRSNDLLRSLVMPSSGVPQVDPDTVDRIKKFRTMIEQGLRVTRGGLLIGGNEAVAAILSDFETTFTEELTR